MFGFLFLLSFIVKCQESELPFENDDDLEDEGDNSFGNDQDFDSNDQGDEQITDDEIKKNEKDIKSTPSPTPAPIKMPIKDLLGKTELGVVIALAISVIYFIIGRRKASQQASAAYEAFSPLIRKYFAVMPRNFSQKSYHDYVIYFSGRTGYIGGVCEIHIRRCCDILGTIYSFITSDHNKIKFDLFLDPKHKPSGVLTIGKERPYEFPEELKLKEVPLSHHLKCFTDFGKERHGYINLINSYMSKSNSIELLELTNANRFEYADNAEWCAHFEFKVNGKWNEFIDEELIGFVMSLSDKFTSAQFPYEIQSANERIREKIINEKNKKTTEKKLTKEEEAKLERRKERREQNKFRPKFKAG